MNLNDFEVGKLETAVQLMQTFGKIKIGEWFAVQTQERRFGKPFQAPDSRHPYQYMEPNLGMLTYYPTYRLSTPRLSDTQANMLQKLQSEIGELGSKTKDTLMRTGSKTNSLAQIRGQMTKK